MNFENFILSSISPGEIAIRMGMAVAFSLIWALLYRTTTDQNYESSFLQSLVLISLIVCLVLTAIGSSLPRAFGLFAALSLIRFRSPIKSIKQMTFLFMSVGIGIAAGSGAYKTLIIACTIVFSVYLIMEWVRINRVGSQRYLIDLEVENQNLESAIQAVEEYLKQKTANLKLSQSFSVSGELSHFCYIADIKQDFPLAKVMGDMNKLEKCHNITFSPISIS